MNHSPYLDQPLRTEAQARADIDRYAGSCAAREATKAESDAAFVETQCEFIRQELLDMLDDDVPCLAGSPTIDKAFALQCRLLRLAATVAALKPYIPETFQAKVANPCRD